MDISRGVRAGKSISVLHRESGETYAAIARVYYNLVRAAHIAGEPVPGAPGDYTRNIRCSLEVAMSVVPNGWFRYRTAVWAIKTPDVSQTIRALRARFAACDCRGGAEIELTLELWQCKRYSAEVRWLRDEGVLPPVARPYCAGEPAVYAPYELRWDSPDAESLGDGSSATCDLDGILAALPGPVPLLWLPAFDESEHIRSMLDLLVETAAAGTFTDEHRVKMKLIAVFIYRAL